MNKNHLIVDNRSSKNANQSYLWVDCYSYNQVLERWEILVHHLLHEELRETEERLSWNVD